MNQAFLDEYPEVTHQTVMATISSFDLADLLSAKMEVGKIVFEYGGHYRGRPKQNPKVPKEYEFEFQKDHFWEEQIKSDLSSAFMRMNQTQRRAFKSLLKKGGDWVELNGILKFRECHECGLRVIYKFNGKAIKAIGRCKYPKGQPQISIDIKVPSGIMVFTNFFDIPAFDGNIEGGYPEHIAELEHYAKHNVAQLFCGNSCPGIYKDGDKFWVGNPGHDDNYEVSDIMPGTQVTSVTTDLWAWSMTDLYNHQKITGKKNIQQDKNNYYSYVRVTPGTYRVTQRFYAKGGYGPDDKADIFATMERVGRRSNKNNVCDDTALSIIGLLDRVKE